MANIEIHRIEAMKLKNPTIILGFPGTGLVGSVAASQLVDSLQLKFGGYITSPDFAPLAAIHDYMPLPAARIHFSEKHNMIVILSEMSIPVGSSMELADKIKYLLKNEPEKKRMEANARKRAAFFSWEKNARKVASIYRELL